MNENLKRESSISLVLDVIRKYGSINRYEIAKKTSLSPATVTNITDRLIKAGFISETPSFISKRGRKPINLTLSNGAHLSIGIEIDSRHITGVVIGLNGNVIKSERIEIEKSTPEDIFKEVILIYNSLIKDLDKKRIIGLGIGIPDL